MYIAPYAFGSYNNVGDRRDRKLLLTGREIDRLAKANKEPGNTIVPLRLFINDRGLAKLVIGIGRGKKEYDKRDAIRDREDKRNLARLFQKK